LNPDNNFWNNDLFSHPCFHDGTPYLQRDSASIYNQENRLSNTGYRKMYFHPNISTPIPLEKIITVKKDNTIRILGTGGLMRHADLQQITEKITNVEELVVYSDGSIFPRSHHYDAIDVYGNPIYEVASRPAFTEEIDMNIFGRMEHTMTLVSIGSSHGDLHYETGKNYMIRELRVSQKTTKMFDGLFSPERGDDSTREDGSLTPHPPLTSSRRGYEYTTTDYTSTEDYMFINGNFQRGGLSLDGIKTISTPHTNQQNTIDKMYLKRKYVYTWPENSDKLVKEFIKKVGHTLENGHRHNYVSKISCLFETRLVPIPNLHRTASEMIVTYPQWIQDVSGEILRRRGDGEDSNGTMLGDGTIQKMKFPLSERYSDFIIRPGYTRQSIIIPGKTRLETRRTFISYKDSLPQDAYDGDRVLPNLNFDISVPQRDVRDIRHSHTVVWKEQGTNHTVLNPLFDSSVYQPHIPEFLNIKYKYGYSVINPITENVIEIHSHNTVGLILNQFENPNLGRISTTTETDFTIGDGNLRGPPLNGRVQLPSFDTVLTSFSAYDTEQSGIRLDIDAEGYFMEDSTRSLNTINSYNSVNNRAEIIPELPYYGVHKRAIGQRITSLRGDWIDLESSISRYRQETDVPVTRVSETDQSLVITQRATKYNGYNKIITQKISNIKIGNDGINYKFYNNNLTFE
jgi:hypothetical protein